MKVWHTNQSINENKKDVEIVSRRFLSFLSDGSITLFSGKNVWIFSVIEDQALKMASKWVLKVSNMFCLICQRYKCSTWES